MKCLAILFFVAPMAFAQSIGVVKLVKGDVQATASDGTARVLHIGNQIHEQDRIATDKSSVALIEFEGGNQLQIFSGTRMSVQEYNQSSIGRRAIFNLFKGKIRGQTKQTFDGKDSHFQIVTQGMLAEVKGTAVFFLTHEKTSHIVTRSQILDGSLALSERMGDNKISLARGESVTYILDDGAMIRDSEWSNSPEKGFFNPVGKMTVGEFEDLYKTDLRDDVATSKTAKIEKAKKAQPICKDPVAQLNQCNWHCVNNGKKAKVCEVDKPNVFCVRLRCNANGDWAEETKLPSSSASKCKAKGDSVDDCDY